MVEGDKESDRFPVEEFVTRDETKRINLSADVFITPFWSTRPEGDPSARRIYAASMAATKLEHLLPWSLCADRLDELSAVSPTEEILSLLLEDPARTVAAALANGHGHQHIYVQREIVWSVQSSLPGTAAHEQSQHFTRTLLGGRKKMYRIHRFTLAESLARELNEELLAFALNQAALEPSTHVSNVGGYHSKPILFERSEGRRARHLFAECLRVAARATCNEAGVESPREGSDPYAWINVSGPGHANQLHCHHGATLAACYYVRVPASTGHLAGSLLLRLTPAAGASQEEPDEERHVRWMAPFSSDPSQTEGSANEHGSDDGTTAVEYAEIVPTAGSLLVFPAWLSHSVAPIRDGTGSSCEELRVSVAANFDFAAPSDEYEGGWRWFRD